MFATLRSATATSRPRAIFAATRFTSSVASQSISQPESDLPYYGFLLGEPLVRTYEALRTVGYDQNVEVFIKYCDTHGGKHKRALKLMSADRKRAYESRIQSSARQHENEYIIACWDAYQAKKRETAPEATDTDKSTPVFAGGTWLDFLSWAGMEEPEPNGPARKGRAPRRASGVVLSTLSLPEQLESGSLVTGSMQAHNSRPDWRRARWSVRVPGNEVIDPTLANTADLPRIVISQTLSSPEQVEAIQNLRTDAGSGRLSCEIIPYVTSFGAAEDPDQTGWHHALNTKNVNPGSAASSSEITGMEYSGWSLSPETLRFWSTDLKEDLLFSAMKRGRGQQKPRVALMGEEVRKHYPELFRWAKTQGYWDSIPEVGIAPKTQGEPKKTSKPSEEVTSPLSDDID